MLIEVACGCHLAEMGCSHSPEPLQIVPHSTGRTSSTYGWHAGHLCIVTMNTRLLISCLSSVCCLLASAPSCAQITDWQKGEPFRGVEKGAPKDLKEDDFKLPDVAIASNWVEFHIGSETRNRYFVARDSLSVGPDAVTRFVSRVLATGGAENIAVEAIRCETGEKRLYANLRNGQEWMRARDSSWKSVFTGNRLNDYRQALYGGLLCEGDQPMTPADSFVAMAASFKARAGNPLTGYR